MQPIKLPQRDKRYGVGKHIGYMLYVHKSAAEAILPQLPAWMQALVPNTHSWDVIKWDRASGAWSFIACAHFDEKDEPDVGISFVVRPDGLQRFVHPPADPWIYHHKWLMVHPNYKGFDVQAAMVRSLRVLHIARMRGVAANRYGRKSVWASEVLPYL